jgi:hypothetical protein
MTNWRRSLLDVVVDLTLWIGGLIPLLILVFAFDIRVPEPAADTPASDDLIKLVQTISMLSAAAAIWYAGAVLVLFCLKYIISPPVLRSAFVPDRATRWVTRLQERVFVLIVPDGHGSNNRWKGP